MVWKKFLILGFISFSFSGCLNYYISKKTGGYYPKKNNFILAKTPYQLQNNDLIKVENLYFSMDTLTFGNGEYNKLFYIKFFKNGRCFENSIDITEKTNINQLNTVGYTGYYSITNKNKIELEFFYVKSKERGWYYKYKGFIRNDTLFVYETDKQKNKNLRIYIPKKIKGLTQITDW